MFLKMCTKIIPTVVIPWARNFTRIAFVCDADLSAGTQFLLKRLNKLSKLTNNNASFIFSVIKMR